MERAIKWTMHFVIKNTELKWEFFKQLSQDSKEIKWDKRTTKFCGIICHNYSRCDLFLGKSCCTSFWMLSSSPIHFSKPTLLSRELRCSFDLKTHHKKLLWRYNFFKCDSFENKLNVAWFMLPMKISQENLRKLWHSVFVNQVFSTSPQIYQVKHPVKTMWFSIIKVIWEWKR